MIVNGDVCAMPGFLLHSAKVGRRSAPHPAEPELPLARAELRALRSAARSAAAVGDGSSAPCGVELFLFAVREGGKTLRTASGRAGAAEGASRASRTLVTNHHWLTNDPPEIHKRSSIAPSLSGAQTKPPNTTHIDSVSIPTHDAPHSREHSATELNVISPS